MHVTARLYINPAALRGFLPPYLVSSSITTNGLMLIRDATRFKRVVEFLNLRNLVIFSTYASTVPRIPCRCFVLCKVTGKTEHFHSC